MSKNARDHNIIIVFPLILLIMVSGSFPCGIDPDTRIGIYQAVKRNHSIIEASLIEAKLIRTDPQAFDNIISAPPLKTYELAFRMISRIHGNHTDSIYRFLCNDAPKSWQWHETTIIIIDGKSRHLGGFSRTHHKQFTILNIEDNVKLIEDFLNNKELGNLSDSKKEILSHLRTLIEEERQLLRTRPPGL